MAIWLEQTSVDFEAQFKAFLSTKREVSEDVNAVVKAIIDDVRARGDAALIDYSARFDGVDLAKDGIRISETEVDAAIAQTDPAVIDALKLAAERIEKHHARQMPKDDIYEDAIGVGLGSRWTAIEAVGLYVPGGTASYPSSVLMNAVPAKVAGVPRLVMVVPAGGGKHGRIDGAARGRHDDDDTLDAGDLGRHGIHQHRARIAGRAAGHIEADRFDSRPA